MLAEDPSGNPVELFEATLGLTPMAGATPTSAALRRPRRPGRPHGVPPPLRRHRPVSVRRRAPYLERRDRAEDVLQEAFVNVWHNAGRYREPASAPLTWLTAIVRNKALDALRGEIAPRRRRR